MCELEVDKIVVKASEYNQWCKLMIVMDTCPRHSCHICMFSSKEAAFTTLVCIRI